MRHVLFLITIFFFLYAEEDVEVVDIDPYENFNRVVFNISDSLDESFLRPTAEIYSDYTCLLYTSPSPRDLSTSRMPSSA